MQYLIWVWVAALASAGAHRADAPSPPAARGGGAGTRGGGESPYGLDFGESSRPADEINRVDGIPGLERPRLKKLLYGLLGKMRHRPRDAVHALLTGEAPRAQLAANASSKGVSSGQSCEGLGCPLAPAGSPQAARPPPAGGRGARVRRRGPAVMYLPINQEQADPCAPPKGAKLMEALPLVFLSSLMSVADAVGNVVNNINNNNNNNNNNNDNNINNDNTNLAANINNANQINLVPLGGRALRFARAVVDAVGSAAMRAYRALVPGSQAAYTTAVPPTTQSASTPTTQSASRLTTHKPSTPTPRGPPTPTTQLPPTTYKEILQDTNGEAAASILGDHAKEM